MKDQLTDQMFSDALFNEDEIGSVIRVHLHIEYYINQILDKLVPYPEDLGPIQLDYFGKVNLICALGVKSERKGVLSAFGNIRNKFAHNPFHKLNKSNVRNLYDTLSSADKKILQEAHNKTRKNRNPVVKPYKELDAKEQFILIAVLVRKIVKRIYQEIE